jgi:hypothetical protein
MSCSEQPIELVFHHLVTLAYDLFQLVAIEDRNRSSIAMWLRT